MTAKSFTPLDFAQLVAVAVIWGVNNVAAKVALNTFPPLMMAAMRFALVLAALAWMLRWPARESIKPLMIMLLLCGPLHFGVQNIGLAMAHDLAPMVIAMQLWVPSSVIGAAILLKEPIQPLRALGVALGFAGVASMAFDPVIFAQGGALVLVAGAAASYGVGTVLVRRIAGVHAWAMQAWLALSITPLLSVGSLTFESGQGAAVRDASWIAWACVAFGGVVSSIVANALLFGLVQRYEVSRTTPYLLLSPVIGIGLGALVLKDPITPQVLLGGVLTLGGVALVAWAEGRFRAVR